MTEIYCKTDMEKHESHSLLMRALHMSRGVNPESRILRSEKGRPYLEGGSSFDFSISHTGNLWLCAVSDQQTGLDVEAADRQIHNMKAISRRFFSPEEQVPENNDCRPDASDRAFLELWTRKEAFIKFLGEGILYGSSSLCTQTALQEGRVSFNVPLCRRMEKQLSDMYGKNVIISLCTAAEEEDFVIHSLDPGRE